MLAEEVRSQIFWKYSPLKLHKQEIEALIFELLPSPLSLEWATRSKNLLNLNYNGYSI